MSSTLARALDDVGDQGVDADRAGRAEQRDLRRGQVLGAQDPGAQGVVDVVVDVGDAVDEADDPPLQRRRLGRAGVVEDAVADRRRQVEAVAVALQHLDHPQRVLVVLEAAPRADPPDAAVEGVLAGVPERRMAEVVAEPDRLGQVLVQPQRAGDGAGDPAGLERVAQPRPVVVPLGSDEDLGLVLQPAEGLRVDDPVAVALERRAQRTVRLGRGALGRIGPGRVRGEELLLPGLDAVLECEGGGHRIDLRGRLGLPLMRRREVGHERGARGSPRRRARPGAARAVRRRAPRSAAWRAPRP